MRIKYEKNSYKRWNVEEVHTLLLHIRGCYKSEYSLDILGLDLYRVWEIAEKLERTEASIIACWLRVRDWGYFKIPPTTKFESICQKAFQMFHNGEELKYRKKNPHTLWMQTSSQNTFFYTDWWDDI